MALNIPKISGQLLLKAHALLAGVKERGSTSSALLHLYYDPAVENYSLVCWPQHQEGFNYNFAAGNAYQGRLAGHIWSYPKPDEYDVQTYADDYLPFTENGIYIYLLPVGDFFNIFAMARDGGGHLQNLEPENISSEISAVTLGGLGCHFLYYDDEMERIRGENAEWIAAGLNIINNDNAPNPQPHTPYPKARRKDNIEGEARGRARRISDNYDNYESR